MREIDIIYTWVDGSDLKHFLSRLQYYFNSEKTSDNKLNRWADNEELKYSLRSLEKHLHINGKIYIVCSDIQRPKYVKESDRVQFISHSQIIPKQYLPTFNSSVIESFLFKIPNLSEYFVYLNDDVMLMRKLSCSDLFTENKPRIFLNPIYSSEYPILETDFGHTCGKKNANRLLDSLFGYEQRREVSHFLYMLKKGEFEFAWDKFGSALNEACIGKFRNKKMVCMSNHLIPHLMIKKGLAEPVLDPEIGLMLGTHDKRFLTWLSCYLKHHRELPEVSWPKEVEQNNPRFIVVDGDKVSLHKFLMSLFPNKSKFEKFS